MHFLSKPEIMMEKIWFFYYTGIKSSKSYADTTWLVVDNDPDVPEENGLVSLIDVEGVPNGNSKIRHTVVNEDSTKVALVIY